MAEPTLSEVFAAVNRVSNKLDLRDDTGDLLRKALADLGAIKTEFQHAMRRYAKRLERVETSTAKRLDDHEGRLDWLERKVGK